MDAAIKSLTPLGLAVVTFSKYSVPYPIFGLSIKLSHEASQCFPRKFRVEFFCFTLN